MVLKVGRCGEKAPVQQRRMLRNTEVKMSESLDCDLDVPSAQALRTLGCRPNQKLTGRLQRQLDTAVREIRERVDCLFAWRSFPVRVEPGRVCVDGKITLRSARLAEAMRPCRRVFAYVVTLGPAVDEYIAECMDRRPGYGIVVDAVASSAAESMVARVEENISEGLAPTEALSLPFSAGYCDWSVREQSKVFSLLPQGAAGVTLSADAMMSPRKSISGVFGAGPVAAVTQAACPCTSCARQDCAHRRRPYSGRNNERFTDRHVAAPHRVRPAGVSLRAPAR